MAEANGRNQWRHTSAILAWIVNVNIDPKKHALFQPKDFDPYHTSEAATVLTGEIKDLKGLFKKGGGP
jgi:hypothetical protein